MAIICWGNLAKSADSTEKIEQSMQGYIETHDENPNAHMGTDYSLGVHRLQTVLDHMPYSVFNSHTYPQSRAYKAIVDQAGNGDGTTIQPAIEYVHNQGGGVILVKNGNYILTDNITLYNNVELVGEDKTDTILNFNGNAKGIIASSKRDFSIKRMSIVNSGDNAIDAYDGWDFGIEDIYLESNDGDIYIHGSGRGYSLEKIRSKNCLHVPISINNVSYYGIPFKLKDIQIESCGGYGMSLGAAWLGYFENIVVYQPEETGIYLYSTFSTLMTFVGCRVIDAGMMGWEISKCQRSAFVGCGAHNPQGDGFYIDNVAECVFSACHAYDSGEYGFNLTALSTKNYLSGVISRWNDDGDVNDLGTSNKVTDIIT